MILLDTGFFLALFNPDDALHHRAAAWSERTDGELLVTEHVLWECVNAFSKTKDRCSAHAIVEYVRFNSLCRFISASPRLFEAGLRLHQNRSDKEWSLTDCISFHVMQERGVKRALAYDIHFEQAGFEALLRKDPPS